MDEKGCLLRPFHGGNRGSNPLGDAISFKELAFVSKPLGSHGNLVGIEPVFPSRNGALQQIPPSVSAARPRANADERLATQHLS